MGLASLAAFPLLLTGCSGLQDLLGQAGGLLNQSQGQSNDSGSVDLSPSAPSSSSALSDRITSNGQAPLPQPDGGPAPVAPAAITPVNLTNITNQEPIQALANHGIKITGSPDDEALKNTWIAAAQLDPVDTQDLTVNFTGGDRTSGTLGVWTNRGGPGLVTIFAMHRPTAILHEICHHATLYTKSTHGNAVSQDVMGWVAQKYGTDVKSWPDSVCTCQYARTNDREWRAEFFSVSKVMELKLPWDYLAENAAAGTFNPPPELRAKAKAFYATNPGGANPST